MTDQEKEWYRNYADVYAKCRELSAKVNRLFAAGNVPEKDILPVVKEMLAGKDELERLLKNKPTDAVYN